MIRIKNLQEQVRKNIDYQMSQNHSQFYGKIPLRPVKILTFSPKRLKEGIILLITLLIFNVLRHLQKWL